MIEEKVSLHELNNILTVIGGASYLLAQKTIKNSDSELTRTINTLNESTKRAMKVIEAARNGFIRNTAVVDLHESVKSMDNILQMLAGEHVKVTLEGEDHCAVSIDPIDLDEIVINLVKNAAEELKKSDTKGEIKIKVGKECFESVCLICNERFKGDYVTLEVENSGPEIPAEAFPKLFERGYTTKNNGSGLGLYSVRLKTHMAGGHVTVKSNTERTSFKLYFPSVTDKIMHAKTYRKVKSGKKAAVLVQDQPVMEVLREFLTAMGVGYVADWQNEVLDVDLMIFDDSINLMEVQNITAGNKRFKTICITDYYVDKSNSDRVIFLIKPFNYETFLKAVECALS